MRFPAPFVIFAASAAVGCGPQCGLIQTEHDTFMARAVEGKPAGRGSHLRLALPMRALTSSVDRAFTRMKSADMDLPGLGDLGRFVPTKLGLTPRKILVSLDKDDAAKVGLDFDIKYSGRTLFGMDLAARAPIQYDRERGKMRFSIRADLFEKIRPRLDDEAETSLTNTLWDLVPGPARLVVGKADVGRIAHRAITALAEQAYELLRDEVLRDLGEITSFEVDFPDIPLAGLSLTSIGGTQGFLRMDARLDLPVERGLPDDDAELEKAMAEISRGQAPAQGELIEVAVSTEAVVALANWGIVKGKVPGRYGNDGKPAEAGPLRVGAAWGGAERPLKVHVWSLDLPGMCMSALAGATPQVSWEKGKLKVGVADSRIENFNGPKLLQFAMDLTHVGEGIFDFTKEISTDTDIGIGGDGWRLGLDSVRLDGQIFRLRLKAGASKKGA